MYPENLEKPQNSLFPGVLRLFLRFDCQKPEYTIDEAESARGNTPGRLADAAASLCVESVGATEGTWTRAEAEKRKGLVGRG